MNKQAKSILKINHFVFDELSFKRKGFRQPDMDEIPYQVETTMHKESVNHYLVTLTITVSKANEFDATVRLTGYCEIDDNLPNRDIILSENVPAILYPYARAQLTLMTAQPETTPVVLPVVNVHEMMRNAETLTPDTSASKVD